MKNGLKTLTSKFAIKMVNPSLTLTKSGEELGGFWLTGP